MLGINQGLVWSLINRTDKHYRTFHIPKGSSFRRIDAPRVALKIVQKWLGTQFNKDYVAPDHVYGFVLHKSHIGAAKRHLKAEWVLSVDIENFFSTTPQWLVIDSLCKMGYTPHSATIISQLTCFNGSLGQGAPSSPVLSNLCFSDMDIKLHAIAQSYGARLTRYADDIVFSGTEAFPTGIDEAVLSCFVGTPWKSSARKFETSISPARRKVHGLLVHGDQVRLTKGYRNRLRAYAHLISTKELDAKTSRKMKAHLAYGSLIVREQNNDSLGIQSWFDPI